MDVKNSRLPPARRSEDDTAPPPAGLDGLLDGLPLAGFLERRPVLRLAPGRDLAVAAERVVVSRRALAAALGDVGGDGDLIRHAEDRIAERFCDRRFHSSGAEPSLDGLPARVPVLLPLPLSPAAAPAPRPGLIGVLPLAAAATASGPPLAERRVELAALGWRIGIGGLDAASLRFVALAALGVDLLLLRWSPALGREGKDALRGADPHTLVLTGCDGADAVEWGRKAGLTLFSGPGAEAAAAGAAPC
ncbi:MAG: hypothetical protein ICV73_06270 [Acetobacteraceae bacterium]|nr:hypothetical protein [Acetobacteraceae bacterium]